MTPNPHVSVQINLRQIRANAESIRQQTGVAIIPVVKADAYGHGAEQIAPILADLAYAFYVFDAGEAVQHQLHALTGKPSIAMLGGSADPNDYLAHHVRPCVWTVARARALRAAAPVISLDTGQQRFGCAPEEFLQVLKAADAGEALTHASTVEQANLFRQATDVAPGLFRHAAGSALLADP